MSKTEEEHFEELFGITEELIALVKFHELDTVDSKAAELLDRYDQHTSIMAQEGDQDLDEYIESIRVANSCPLS